MPDQTGVGWTYLDEVLGYEPVKQIYSEIVKVYPDLVGIAKDKSKRKLKPLVLFKSDLEALEADMVKNYGGDNSHNPVIWRANESQMQGDDTLVDGIPAGDKDEEDEDQDEEEEEDVKPPPKKGGKDSPKKR